MPRAFEQFRTKEKPQGGWVRDEALAFINSIESAVSAAGFALGLGGSLLLKGASAKDLDLLVFPTNSSDVNWAALRNALFACGLRLCWSRAEIATFWERAQSDDRKNVEVWRVEETGKRVDIFMLT